jgi:hypothetical protein
VGFDVDPAAGVPVASAAGLDVGAGGVVTLKSTPCKKIMSLVDASERNKVFHSSASDLLTSIPLFPFPSVA